MTTPRHRLIRRAGLLLVGAMLAIAATVSGATAGQPPVSATAADALRPVAKPKPVTTDITVSSLAAKTGISIQAAAQRIARQKTQKALAVRLSRQLGGGYGGAYLDQSGALTVNVTTAAAAAQVRGAGASARTVKYSDARLTQIRGALDRQSAPAGSSWRIDVAADRVRLTIPTSAPAAKTRALLATARQFGDAVVVERSNVTLTTKSELLGGYPIYHSSGARCSNGFNVTAGGAYYVLTAGHCAGLGGDWFNYDGAPIGPAVAAYFPGQDHGLIWVNGPITLYNGVYLYNGFYQPIVAAADSFVGEYVCKSGSTTGVTCGYVTGKNLTVSYPQGTVFGLDDTSLCSAPGDSGGSLFDGGTALGLLSGGPTSGPCRTFFQPVIAALGYWGVSLI